MNAHTPLSEAEYAALRAEMQREVPEVTEEAWWDDPKAPARGIAVGLCISLAMWAVIIGAVGAWAGWW